MKSIWLLAKTIALFLSVGLFISGCSIPMTYSRDVKTFTPMPPLKLKTPTGEVKRAETNYMVAFVAVDYEATTNQRIESMRRIGLSDMRYRKMDVAEFSYLESIKKALQIDLDQTLLAKKIRVLGPFKTRDEMTFDEKKRAIYTFTPQILIDVSTKFTNSTGRGYTEEGEILVSGKVFLILRESITGEKIWTKRIEADPITKPYKFVAKHKNPNMVYSAIDAALVAGVNEEDNTDVVLAEALSEFYASLGDKLWRHIDTEEWEKYLTQAEHLRKEKRY